VIVAKVEIVIVLMVAVMSNYNTTTTAYGVSPPITNMTNTITNYTNYAIRGRMIVVNHIISNGLDMSKDEIKSQIAHDLALKMIENEVISFTRRDDLANDDRHIAGRVFLVPSEDVQLLRILNNELPKR